MARNFHRRNRISALSEINVTPLIDLAFALLIIFMITAPLLEQTIPLNLPAETRKPQVRTEGYFRAITLDGQGRYFWEGELVSEERLMELLEEAAAEPSPPILNIRADARLPYQSVVTLMDLVKRHDLSRISLDTQVR